MCQVFNEPASFLKAAQVPDQHIRIKNYLVYRGWRSLLSHFSTLRMSFLSRHIPNPAACRFLRFTLTTCTNTAMDLPRYDKITDFHLRTSSNRTALIKM